MEARRAGFAVPLKTGHAASAQQVVPGRRPGLLRLLCGGTSQPWPSPRRWAGGEAVALVVASGLSPAVPRLHTLRCDLDLLVVVGTARVNSVRR